ncbi:MAG: SMP-30/gluconolactonase/LRE family protein, partial [Planctomycetota bacterium]
LEIFGSEFATKKAGLYLFRGQDQKLIRLRDDQICSNGKSIIEGADGQLRLLDIDSPTRQIVSYRIDIAAGSIDAPAVVIDFEGDPGVPDGAIVTPDQKGIIVSVFRPEVAEFGETRWYDLASGELRCTWQTPGSPQNTCPALIPHDGQLKLLITTAVEHMSEEDQKRCPNAGQLFIADTDFIGDIDSVAVSYDG